MFRMMCVLYVCIFCKVNVLLIHVDGDYRFPLLTQASLNVVGVFSVSCSVLVSNVLSSALH